MKNGVQLYINNVFLYLLEVEITISMPKTSIISYADSGYSPHLITTITTRMRIIIALYKYEYLNMIAALCGCEYCILFQSLNCIQLKAKSYNYLINNYNIDQMQQPISNFAFYSNL
jgi:hypothetical protein